SFYSGCCGLFVPDDLTAFMTHHVAVPHALPPYWWGSVRLQVGVADLTCARSVVRHLVPFVHPVDRSRRFGHVSGLAVEGVMSWQPSRILPYQAESQKQDLQLKLPATRLASRVLLLMHLVQREDRRRLLVS
ncbi:hypothetical protein BHM03_00056142, partial [Ensete ventricosum]